MQPTLEQLSNELADAVARTGPEVVAIHARPRAASSGVYWRPGVVVTAEHTIRREEELKVTLPDGSSMGATLAGRDPGTDLAVLRMEGLTGAPAASDAADELRVGTLVLAVGRGVETGVQASLGLISAVQGSWRTWRGGRIDRYIRLDMRIYPGLSGAAVVGPAGRILGMATSGLSRFAAVAIPTSTIDRVVDELLAKGHVSRPYLGVGLHPVRLPEPLEAGLIVLTVEPGSPAAAAGLTVGDVLISLGAQPLRDVDDVQAALDRMAVGQAAEVEAVRGGRRQDFSVTVGERPRGEA